MVTTQSVEPSGHDAHPRRYPIRLEGCHERCYRDDGSSVDK